MSEPILFIKGWRDNFENADTRKRERLKYFFSPSGCDSRGYRLLMRQGKDGLAAMGVFQALCQFAATMKKDDRGRFINSDGTGMEMADLWEVTRINSADFQQAIELLKSVGWLGVENEQVTDNLPTICHKSADNLPLSCQSSPGFVQGEGKGEGQGQGQGEGKGESCVDSGESHRSASDYSEAFEQFWQQVPHKVAKGEAWKEWKIAIKAATAETIIDSAWKFKASEDARQATSRGDFQHLHPSRWLKQRRWEDEIKTQEQKQSEKYQDGQW